VKPNQSDTLGQFSVRAIDEWWFATASLSCWPRLFAFPWRGGARSLNPRIGLQFDANARTRLRAAYASGGEEARTQSVTTFENSQIAFTDVGKRPIAFVDGQR